jgi:uncharacterized paraquat-inducible protein A
MKLLCQRCHLAFRTPGLDTWRSRLLTVRRCPRCGQRFTTREQWELAIGGAFALVVGVLVFLVLIKPPR